MRETRQITVLRSLFRSLHPVLTSGLKNSIETGLAPARRMLTGAHQQAQETETPGSTSKSSQDQIITAEVPAVGSPSGESNSAGADDTAALPARARPAGDNAQPRPELPPLPKTLTDEHLVAELENATRQFDLPGTPARKPARGRRHYSRDTLLSLLEEAKVRIQVLETELELARGTDEQIPLLTEEWSDDLPSTYSRKPD